MNRLSFLIILVTGCYIPADIPESERLSGLEQCDGQRSWTCIEQTTHMLDPSDYEFCSDHMYGINLNTASAQEICDYDRCTYLMNWSKINYIIVPDCYQAACPDVWYARAAFDLCTYQSGDTIDDESRLCIQESECGRWISCNGDRTSEQRIQFNLDVNECSVATKDYLVDKHG